MLKTKEEIKAWLDRMEVKKYTINDDLTVDVNTSVNLAHKGIKEIPFQFGTINGAISFWGNELESLKGAPYIVRGDFDCSANKLTSLQYCPKEVTVVFIFADNQLTNLDDTPESVGIFAYYGDYVKNLNGFKTKVTEHFIHECIKAEERITQFESFYKTNPNSHYKFRLKIHAKQLKAIQQEEELRLNLPTKENLPSKRIKV